MSEADITNTDKYTLKVEGDTGPFRVKTQEEIISANLKYIHFTMTSDQPAVPNRLHLSWMYPAAGVVYHWDPLTMDRFNLSFTDKAWGRYAKSKVNFGAPVQCLYGANDRNKITFALSDTLNPIEMGAGIFDNVCEYICEVTLFNQPTAPLTEYRLSIRIDTRDIPYYESLDDVQKWWVSMPGHEPTPVPQSALEPVYSTWYSMLQELSSEKILTQCRIARDMGCKTVIVDDGWQTSDEERGYNYCGDWQVCSEKIASMRQLVEKVHKLDMKFMLWYSVPFVGEYSKNWKRFEGKFLNPQNEGWRILDPRFDEVREYLITTYEKAVKEFDLDGLKLDFIDEFDIQKGVDYQYGNGRDFQSVEAATFELIKSITQRLKAIKPDILIEYRQNYVGPLVRVCGNMLRSNDCPTSALINRKQILDLRLLSGNTAVHSDMIIWDKNDSVENIARQFISLLFSVPQISVMLDKISDSAEQVIRFWLQLWLKYRDVFLKGKLRLANPHGHYSQAYAETDNTGIAVLYDDVVLNPGNTIPEMFLVVNGTSQNRVVLEINNDIGERSLEIYDCCGILAESKMYFLKKGLHSIDVPPSGVAMFSKKGLTRNRE
jgi:alpha-galactosidase